MKTRLSGNSGSRRGLLWVYLAFYLFFLFKMWFYDAYVGHFPDEMEHVSYVAYLEQSGRVLPDFSKMYILARAGEDGSTLNQSDDFSGVLHFSSQVNYLGHPPLYYQYLRLSRGVRVSGGAVTVDIQRLRGASMLLAAAAMLIILYIGWSRIRGGVGVHLLFGALCVSVPMLAYVSAGVNNDTLALLGVAVFLLGYLRAAEGRQNIPTGLLFGGGVFLTMMDKLTAGLLVGLMAALGAVAVVWRHRSLRPLRQRAYYAALPFFALAGVYFLWVFVRTGSAQPTLRRLNPAQFYSSGFYVAPAQRKTMNFAQFLSYFRYAITVSWTGIFSHVRYVKAGSAWSPDQLALAAMWVLAPLAVCWRSRFPAPGEKPGFRGVTGALAAGCAAIWATVAIQCVRSYLEFRNVSGYLGGTSSRYYLCVVPVMALSMVLPFARPQPFARRKRRLAVGGCVVYSLLLIYEDFGYFLLHFGAAVIPWK